MNLQYGDELNVRSAGERDELERVINILKSRYPDVIISSNQAIQHPDYITIFTASHLKDYVVNAKPDMLHFSSYPYMMQGTGVCAYEGQSPLPFYVNMEVYRQAGLAGLDGTGKKPIPCGMFVQTFEINNHMPTESEYRLQIFAGLAFGFKQFSAFLYIQNVTCVQNNSSENYVDLFFDYDGIGPWAAPVPKPELYTYAAMMREAKKLAPTLVRLISTDVRMLMGEHKNASGLSIPNQIPSDSWTDVSMEPWNSSVDPYMTDIEVQNTGTKNEGLAGDIIVGYFKPLDDSLAEPGYENDIYFMIVNGLIDETGDADDCKQQITLKFDFGSSGISNLKYVDANGAVSDFTPQPDRLGKDEITFELKGGTGMLFKYDTGGKFIGLE